MSDSVVSKGLTRREALKVGAGAAGGMALAGGMLGKAMDAAAAPAVIGAGPYGPLQAPDANGVRLPKGFTSRIIASTGVPLGASSTPFHLFPDGMGTFKTDDGGFIMTSNCEAPTIEGTSFNGGAGAIRFDKNFNVVDYYRILSGTNVNCAGGITPWGTWLSCEEVDLGKVWECDPTGDKPAVAHAAMGVFKHEASVVDPVKEQVYLTEDQGDGCFYRFTPDNYPDLSAGKLHVAAVAGTGQVGWVEVPDPRYLLAVPTRLQVPGATTFKRSEGCWYDEGVVYFATTQDDRVYAYHVADAEIEVIYDGVALGEEAPLHDIDNVMVSPLSGDLYAAEDTDDLQICIISAEGEAAAFAQVVGQAQEESELVGPIFDPTGKRFYFASQRGDPAGRVFEITGPFRITREQPPTKTPDKDKPKIKIRVLGKPSLRGLLKHGQPFKINVRDESLPVTLEAKLITRMKRKSGKGSRDVTIGTLRTKAGKAGDRKIRMTVGKRHKARLRKRDVAQARLVVTATDAAGNKSKTVKKIRFG